MRVLDEFGPGLTEGHDGVGRVEGRPARVTGPGKGDPGLVHERGQFLRRVVARQCLVALGVQVVEARSSVRERLRGEGLDQRLGGIDRFTSVADLVDSMQKAR